MENETGEAISGDSGLARCERTPDSSWDASVAPGSRSQGSLGPHQVLGRVHADAGQLRSDAADTNPVLQGPELFQRLGLLQRARRKLGQVKER